MERTALELAVADVVLLVLDAATPMTSEDTQVIALISGGPAFPPVIAFNRAIFPRRPRPPTCGRTPRTFRRSPGRGSPICARGSSALSVRETKAVARVRPAPRPRRWSPTRATSMALRRAQRAIYEARNASTAAPGRRALPGEIVAGEIRIALESLGEVTGEAVAPDLLDRIFARFCVGK